MEQQAQQQPAYPDYSGLIKPANEVFPPQKILAYGVQGIGKNTFASTFRSPVLIRTEDGAEATSTLAFPRVTTYDELMGQLSYLLYAPHEHRTLVIDTLDWLEPIVTAACCAHNQWANIESVGYGKGYVVLDQWWNQVMVWLDGIRDQRGMDIIVLAHSDIKTISPPDTDQYDTYQIKMQKRAFGLWQEWASMVLFFNFKVSIKQTKTGVDQVRTRGTGSGDRVIYTTERPAWKAKNRWNLPDEILIGKDATWAAFHQTLEACTGGRYVSPIPAQPKTSATKTK